MGGEAPAPCKNIVVLGVCLHETLEFGAQLGKSRAAMDKASTSLFGGLVGLGFGMPFQAAQIASRVEAKALYGCEVLSSFGGGHAAAFRSLNDANYAMAKKLLGVPSHVSLGSHVKVFSETRVLTRTGAKAAQRIIMLRARLRCLGPNHLVTEVVQAVARQPHGTWWEHSRQVMLGVGLLRRLTRSGRHRSCVGRRRRS